ncbi:hypothetical protein [Bradyrhizobium sp. BR 10289]|uniref:hypothetical protein n=1 Tax=Bradyrhizobium sp. BR 10289 TaxID=2749993 RepID=UPI001C647B8A|nr:hypothetical protein [Bradyrhizobium sp. BR 10289]MBW7969893.1 hypothetical protein [Bradyrhizobium sp. BR 10289]
MAATTARMPPVQSATRGDACVVIAGANVHAGEVALDVTRGIFEVMGALGHDRQRLRPPLAQRRTSSAGA